MRIDAAGNVGIGVSNPSSYSANANNLVIGGEANVGMHFDSNSSTGNGGIYFSDQTAVRGILAYAHTDDAMQFFTNGTTERMRIDSSGRVGIGTSSPNTTFKLEVSGEIPAIFTATSAVASSMYGGVVAHRNTNTVGNGMGIGFQLEDAGNVDTVYAYIGGIIESNTAGSEDGGMILLV